MIRNRIQAECRGVAHLALLEGLVVEVEDVYQAGVVGTALGHEVGLDEGLHRADDAQDQVEQDCGSDHREGDVAHLVPGVAAVDLDRLVELAWDALQPGQEG